MVKENKYLWLRCLIAFALQFLAFVYKPFVIVEFVYLILLIILDKPENKICYLFFMLPFYNVFRYSAGAFRFNNIFDSLKTLYLSTILVLVFCLVMGIHFVLDIKNKKKSINLKSIIVLAILYILFLVPFNSIDSQAFSSILVISSLFLATYLIYQYKECFNLRKILDIWLIGVVLSVVTYLFKDILPYLGDYIVQFEQRFSGLQRDPNYFGFELMVLLLGYTILFFKQQLKYEALIPFGIISIIAIFTLSKSFLISYVLYLAVLLVYLLRYILKQIKDKKKKLTFICLIATGVVICGIVAIIVLPKLFEGRANVVDTKSGGVYNFINSLTTGRLGIWIDYIKLYFKSFWRVVFGYGSLNGYPMDAIHNTPLQILFFGGIIAFGILIYALIKFIKNHKCPAIFYILMGILLIHSCSVDLLFSYRTYLILAITMLCFDLCKKEQHKDIKDLVNENSRKLSVIIPIYNAGKYIERCVNSLTKHKELNLEIILVNDGSTDNSGHICKQLALSDDRVNVIEKSNGGVSSARNEGLKYATGEYVTFIDADDFVSDEFKDCYSVLGESEIYCVPYCEIKGDNKRLIIPTTDWNGKVATNLNNGAVTTGLYNSVCMKIFKTSIIKENNIEFDTSLKIAEDFKFVIDCFKVSNTIDFVGCCYYNYFRNDTSAMHKVDFEKICNTLDACKYAINTVKNIKSVNIKKLCLKLVSENLLSVFARVNDYSSDKNKYLMEELCKLKQYFSYGSSIIKKGIIISIKTLGLKITARLMKVTKR